MTASPRPLRSWRGEYLALCSDLIRARVALGMPQDRAAALIGVGRRTFQRWETGESSPDALHLFRWSDIVGISITSAPKLAPPIAA